MRMTKLIDTLRVRSHLWRSSFVKWCGGVFGIWGVVVSFISLDDLGLNSTCLKIMALLVLLILSCVGSAVHAALKRNREFWSCGSSSLQACYGDLFSFADDFEGGHCCCVIPVNTTFDTVVDKPGSCAHPLVSPFSLHGLWLSKMEERGLSVAEIDRRIDDALADVDPASVKAVPSGFRGKTNEYPVGTVVPFTVGNITYLLTALSQFDSRNVAHSDRENLLLALNGVIEFHDGNGQGCNLVIPLMGTGLSRMGLDHKGSFNLITSFLTLHRDKLTGHTTVVVYSGDVDKLSIWD